jgi:hypothetical protein
VIFTEKSSALVVPVDQNSLATLNSNREAINEYTEVGRVIKDCMENYGPE